MKNILIAIFTMSLFACGGSNVGSSTDLSSSSSVGKVKYPKSSEKLHWLTIEEAQELNKSQPRQMIVDVYTEWCGPCKMMDRMTFSDPKVIKKVHDEYYAVKFDAESANTIKFGEEEFANPNHNPNTPKNRRNSPHEFSRFLKVRGYPSLVIINPDLTIKNSLVGFKQPDQLLAEL